MKKYYLLFKAIFIKNYRIEVASKSGLLLPILSTFLALSIFYFLSKIIYKQEYNLTSENYFSYLFIGIIFAIIISMIIEDFPAKIRILRYKEMIDAYLSSAYNFFLIMIAECIFSIFRGIIFVIGLFIFFKFVIHINFSLFNILLLLLTLLFTLPFFIFVSIILSLIDLCYKKSLVIGFIFRRGVELFSGIYFPVMLFPEKLQYISKIIPLTYAVDLARKIFFDTYNNGQILYVFSLLILFDIISFLVVYFIYPLFLKRFLKYR